MTFFLFLSNLPLILKMYNLGVMLENAARAHSRCLQRVKRANRNRLPYISKVPRGFPRGASTVSALEVNMKTNRFDKLHVIVVLATLSAIAISVIPFYAF